MESNTPETAKLTHYRIYVYQNALPPLGQPVATTLCPNRRPGPKTLSGDTNQVTCPACLKHIEQFGLYWDV